MKPARLQLLPLLVAVAIARWPELARFITDDEARALALRLRIAANEVIASIAWREREHRR